MFTLHDGIPALHNAVLWVLGILHDWLLERAYNDGSVHERDYLSPDYTDTLDDRISALMDRIGTNGRRVHYIMSCPVETLFTWLDALIVRRGTLEPQSLGLKTYTLGPLTLTYYDLGSAVFLFNRIGLVYDDVDLEYILHIWVVKPMCWTVERWRD